MLLQRLGRAVGLVALSADMRPLAGLKSLVVGQVALVIECLVAGAALELGDYLPLVLGVVLPRRLEQDLVDVFHVLDEILSQQETFLANIARDLK